MKPERGGVARLPAPQPMKNMEDMRPVTLIFLATQEKQEPNCHEIKNPKQPAILLSFYAEPILLKICCKRCMVVFSTS